MEKGTLCKITTYYDEIYWGIYNGDGVFSAIKGCIDNFTGLSGTPTIPVPLLRLPHGAKVRKWKPKTFDRQICKYGLCVREGGFADRFTITEETANELANILEQIRRNNKGEMRNTPPPPIS